MKKLFLLSLLISLFTTSLLAQHEKNDPLIVINGKVSKTELSSIDSNTIESLTVLKDQPAIDAYGEAGRNGVFIIETTKDNIKLEE